MAAGISDTFRQVGVSVGVAVWGAIFVARGADKVSELAAGTPAANGDHPRQLVEAASSGDLDQAVAGLPPQYATTCVVQRRPRRLPLRLQRGADAGRRWSASSAPCWRSGWSASDEIEREPVESSEPRRQVPLRGAEAATG